MGHRGRYGWRWVDRCAYDLLQSCATFPSPLFTGDCVGEPTQTPPSRLRFSCSSSLRGSSLQILSCYQTGSGNARFSPTAFVYFNTPATVSTFTCPAGYLDITGGVPVLQSCASWCIAQPGYSDGACNCACQLAGTYPKVSLNAFMSNDPNGVSLNWDGLEWDNAANLGEAVRLARSSGAVALEYFSSDVNSNAHVRWYNEFNLGFGQLMKDTSNLSSMTIVVEFAAGIGGVQESGSPSPSPSATAMIPCPLGQYHSTPATCANCSAGRYGVTTGLVTPSCSGPCSPGRYGLFAGATSSSCSGPCSAGYACPAGSTTPTAVLCGPGTYSVDGAGVCSSCAAGFYCAGFGFTTGTPSNAKCVSGFACPPGSANGTTVRCAAGHFCPPGTPSATAYSCISSNASLVAWDSSASLLGTRLVASLAAAVSPLGALLLTGNANGGDGDCNAAATRLPAVLLDIGYSFVTLGDVNGS